MWSVRMSRKKLWFLLLCAVMLTGCGSRREEEIFSTEEQDIVTEILQETVYRESSAEEYLTEESLPEESLTENAETGETEPKETEPEETEPAEPPRITIRMVGDILLHDRVAQYAMQEDGSYQFDVIFDDLEEEISGADLAIVNQEVIIAGEEFRVSGYPNFNAPFELGHALVDVGFDVVCHGTNHALDKGKAGLLSCLDFWEAFYPEIAVLGINETAEEQEAIYIYEQEGIRIAVLNYTYGTNGIPLPADMPYAVNLLQEDKVIADIRAAEELADFTVICPHWGTEYVLEETKEQERWVQLFLEHGVDLVIGTHPHVIEPIEMITEEETGREMLVYYSLGNYVNWTSSSGAGIANRMVGGMAEVTVTLDETGKAFIEDYSVTALVTHLEEKVNGVYTTKLSDYSQEASLENRIVAQDPAFSKEYCVDLCNQVWGDLWK